MRNDKEQTSFCKMLPRTDSTACPESEKKLRIAVGARIGLTCPPLGIEFVRLWEDIWVVVDCVRVHYQTGFLGDCIFPPVHWAICRARE